jgi:hypothetical protein
LRSTVAACFEGGRVEVDSGSATMTKSLRKWTVAACSKAEVEVVGCSRARDKPVACSGAGIKDSRWQWQCGNF